MTRLYSLRIYHEREEKVLFLYKSLENALSDIQSSRVFNYLDEELQEIIEKTRDNPKMQIESINNKTNLPDDISFKYENHISIFLKSLNDLDDIVEFMEEYGDTGFMLAHIND